MLQQVEPPLHQEGAQIPEDLHQAQKILLPLLLAH